MDKTLDAYRTQADEALAGYLKRKGLSSPRWCCALFDMDGVLFDSMPAHARSWLETADAYGLPMTEEDVYMFEGQTGRQSIDILIHRRYARPATEQEMTEIYAHKTELFVRYNAGDLIRGAEDLVRQMRELDRVLVTGSSQRSLIDKVQSAYPDAFSADRLITGLDVQQGKPHPEPYLKGMERVGARAEECIVIENAPSGARSAREAGAFVLVVNTGPLADDILYKYGADIVCPNMEVACVVAEVLLQAGQTNN